MGIRVSLYMCICVYVCMCVCVYVYVCMCVCVYVYAYVYMCMCVCVNVCGTTYAMVHVLYFIRQSGVQSRFVRDTSGGIHVRLGVHVHGPIVE